MRHRRLALLAAVGAVLTGAGLAGPAAAAPARTSHYAAIHGSGSGWAALAIDQWSAHLAVSRGITINFDADGSTEGRQDYIQGRDDFAASDAPFRGGRDKLANLGPQRVPYGFSYAPDAAGGTAFLYHIVVGHHWVRNLRLTPRLILDIFTGKISNWDSPQITQVYGHRLPSLPIIPVVHMEGSGDSFFLSDWLAHQFPRQWNAFCFLASGGRVKSHCGPTEIYPLTGWSPNLRGENGSSNVAAFIKSPYANGAIGYDEYSYGLLSKAPVVRLRNPAGRYVLPTPASVTDALTAARINENPSSPDFLQQNLDRVYTFRDPRSYPLSSYSYLIVPRAGRKPAPPGFSRARGRTLSTFLSYLLCPAAQRLLPRYGYAELPPGLVRGGLLVARRIPGHVRVPKCA
jgi:ABC-type phosphate transport system substrate-binding protein